jgi:colicin import membrane protein
MAERIVVVCDICGKSPSETVAIAAKDKSYRKDLCAEHLAELLKGARAPKRGRPVRTQPASASAAPRRRGRPPKAAAATAPAPAVAAKRERKKITDPVILAKRRAALVKARQARADKRAAATSA